MKREDIEQLNNLRKEISELETAIERIRQQSVESVTDKVKSSGNEFPYIDGFKKISGINLAAESRKKKVLIKKEQLLRDRKEKAERAELKITEYINSVPDSRIRRIMQFRFIEGFTWEKIGGIMSCDRTTAEKILNRYLNKDNNIE